MGTPAPSPSTTPSFDFTGESPAVGTPAPSVIALLPSESVTPAPAPKVTPSPITIPILPGLQFTLPPTAKPTIPVVSIRLKMGGNAKKRQEGVNAILSLIGGRLKVKGKINWKRRESGTASAKSGLGNNGQNGKNGWGANRAPENTNGTNENAHNNAIASMTSLGNNGADGQGGVGTGSNGNNTSSTPSNGQSNSNGPFKPDKGKPNTRLLDASSSSHILQEIVRMALEEQGVLCVEGTDQEEMDIDFENYADEDKVRSLVQGMRDGSIPVTLEDGTPVRDMVCQAETSMSMVAVLSDVPDGSGAPDGINGLDSADSKGSGLSRDYVILMAVLGGVAVLFVGIVIFHRRSQAAARVTQI